MVFIEIFTFMLYASNYIKNCWFKIVPVKKYMLKQETPYVYVTCYNIHIKVGIFPSQRYAEWILTNEMAAMPL